jgi:hypothetical protein
VLWVSLLFMGCEGGTEGGLMGVYRFGAVLEEFEVRDAMENMFSTL